MPGSARGVILGQVGQNTGRSFAGIGHADGVAQRQHRTRRDGEFIHTDGQEGFGQSQVCTQLAADTNPNAVLVGILGNHLDQAQHRQMMGIVEAAQVIVLAVAGQGVLGQVVGTDAEEIHFLGQTVTADSSSRRFDHDTDLNVLAVGDALFLEVALDFLTHTLGFPDFPDAGDHGEHDAQLAEGRSTEQRTQLGAENLRPGQADAQSAHTHGGVVLLGQVEVTDLFVGADVQRADDDFLAVHIRQNGLVCLELLIFGGEIVGVEVEELAAEQTDAAAVVDLHGMHVLRRTDVAVNADGLAVLGHVGLPLQGFQKALQAQLLFPLLHQAVAGIVVGVNDQRTGAAVGDGLTALVLRLQCIAQANNGGDAHGAGQNGGVAGTGTACRNKAQDLGLVQLDGFGRSQIIRSQQDRDLGGNTALHHAAQDAQNPLADVLDVGGTGLHIGIVHRGKHCGELFGHVGNSSLGIEFFFVDEVFDGFLVVQVFSHHLVCFKQHGGFVAGLGAGLLGQLAQLLNGAGLSTLEAMPLGLRIFHGVALDLGRGTAVEIQRSDADTG